MVLRKYRYIAIKIKSEVKHPNSIIDVINKTVANEMGESVLYKLCNMSILDYLEDSRICVVRVDRSASKELIGCLRMKDNQSLEVLFVSGIYKKLLRKIEKRLKADIS